MLLSQQLAELTTGGICYIHSHERHVPDAIDRAQLAAAEPVRVVVGTSYTATWRDELLLVNTSASDVRVTLPLAEAGREFQVVKTQPQNVLYILPTAPDTVLGSADGVQVFNQFTSIRFKSVPGGYVAV